MTSPSDPTVCAIIVTFNRLKLLKRCIDALLQQSRRPDQILVIDHESTDGTREWLQNCRDVEFISQPNAGSAGGFFTGIRHAIDLGFSHLWLMDDDGWAEPECLEILAKEAARTSCAYIAPDLIDDQGISHFEHLWQTCPSGLITYEGGPFNGILIRSDLIARIGNVNREYFIWGDEYEFTDRIKFAGEVLLTSRAARFHHVRSLPRFGALGKRGFFLGRNTVWRLKSFRPGAYPATSFYAITLWKLGKQISQSLKQADFKGVGIILSGAWQGLTTRAPQTPQ